MPEVQRFKGFPVPIKVLLADDNEPVRKAITRLLGSEPTIQLVAETTTFAQTLQIASELQPHVIVMDLHMGDEKNVTPSQVKSSLSGSKIVAISIWNDDESKALANSLGAILLLDKIDLAAELIPAIKRCAMDHNLASLNPMNLRDKDLREAD
jgi:two-component system, NarL family, response regulator DevR